MYRDNFKSLDFYRSLEAMSQPTVELVDSLVEEEMGFEGDNEESSDEDKVSAEDDCASLLLESQRIDSHSSRSSNKSFNSSSMMELASLDRKLVPNSPLQRFERE